MSRKRRLIKVEKQLARLMKSVSRLERGKRKPSHHNAKLPARRAGSAQAADTVKRRTVREAPGKRAPTTPKATGSRARRSGGAALSTLPS
jgi:hypothetical protein